MASTSWENEMFATVLVPAARAAAISRRWVWDLLGGGVTVPEREWGMIRMSIYASSPARMTGSRSDTGSLRSSHSPMR